MLMESQKPVEKKPLISSVLSSRKPSTDFSLTLIDLDFCLVSRYLLFVVFELYLLVFL